MTQESECHQPNPLWGLIGKATTILVLLFIVYISIEFIPSTFWESPDRVRILTSKIETIAREAWNFIKPLLQLAIIVLILEYLARKHMNNSSFKDWFKKGDVQSLLALIVVTAFCIGAVAGVGSVGSLEDIALVVIGFYFGGLAYRDNGSSSREVVVREGKDE